jgi:hypothetical protein
MTTLALSGNASGAGAFTLATPSSANTRTLTLPDATTTLVGTDTTQTLANKTLTSLVIDSATFATVSGTAPLYGCRAWVNFDGTKDTTGAVSTANTNRLIRASGNVTSVLRNGAGDFTITFTTAMPDANYSLTAATQVTGVDFGIVSYNSTTAPTTTTVRILVSNRLVATDNPIVSVAIFR